MSHSRRTLLRILSGTSDKNIRFRDLCSLLLSLKFDERTKASHHIFTRSGVDEIINIQPLKDGHAKPYQVKQVREIIIRYKLVEDIEP